jgi:hypothetical protein
VYDDGIIRSNSCLSLDVNIEREYDVVTKVTT